MCKKTNGWFFKSGKYYYLKCIYDDLFEFQSIDLMNNSYLFVGQVSDYFHTIKEYRKKKLERLNALW